jgi:hypothetical protein
MNEDYNLSGCETMQLTDALENILPPFSRSQAVKTLGGLLTPDKDGNVHHQTQQFLHLCQQPPVNKQHNL